MAMLHHKTHSTRFFFFAVLRGLQDLSSLTRNGTWAPAVIVPSPNHQTAREFPSVLFIY